MSFFGKILDKLGIGGDGSAAAPPRAAPAAGAPRPAAGPTYPQAGAPATSAAPRPQAGQAAPSSAPATTVDVEAQMEQRATSAREPLNWRTSIVDLLKLLDLDSSLQARKELARELGCPPEFMDDSAKMNMWLHRAVLERISANGGRLPDELLD